MPEYKRSQRIADLLQRELAELLYRRIKDPRLNRITVTGVEVSDDLRYARIFYCFLGAVEEDREISDSLQKARGFIRRELGSRLQLRYLPELDFRYDASFEYGAKIERLLKELHSDG
jgi:ribosome-binding factor A